MNISGPPPEDQPQEDPPVKPEDSSGVPAEGEPNRPPRRRGSGPRAQSRDPADAPPASTPAPAGGTADVSATPAGSAPAPRRQAVEGTTPQAARQGEGAPPGGGFADWLGENGPARLPLVFLLLAAMLLAGYVGHAIGDSLEGSNNVKPVASLASAPTSQAGGREVACGGAPIDLE